MSKKRLIENAFSLGLVQVASLGLPLLSLPYLAKTLGADQMGRMAFALSIAQILVIFTDYGFNLSAPKQISIYRDNPNKITEIWCTVTLIRILFAIIGAICVVTGMILFNQQPDDIQLFSSAYIMVIGNIVFPQWLFQGLEKLKVVSLVQVIAKFIVFAMIFFMVHSEADIYLATLLQGSGYLLGGILSIPFTVIALKNGRLTWPTITAIKQQLKSGQHVFFSTAATNIYTTSNTFFIGLFVSSSSLGNYHVAEKLIRAVQALYAPISNAVYPHVTRLAETNYNALLAFNRKLLLLGSLFAGLASVSVYFIAPYAINLVFGPSYIQAAEILQAFASLPFIIFISNIFGIQTMLPIGMESVFSKVLIFAALLNFSIFIPAVYYFGGIGAAWANVTVEIFVTLTMGICLHKADFNPITSKLKHK
jgi:PST family polysaccharide transporter